MSQTSDLQLLASVALVLLCGCSTEERRRPEVRCQTAEVARQASGTTLALHFAYRQWPLTNCCLESSTDLVHWENRDDFSVETNANGIVDWRLKPAPLKPREFFRIAGETIE